MAPLLHTHTHEPRPSTTAVLAALHELQLPPLHAWQLAAILVAWLESFASTRPCWPAVSPTPPLPCSIAASRCVSGDDDWRPAPAPHLLCRCCLGCGRCTSSSCINELHIELSKLLLLLDSGCLQGLLLPRRGLANIRLGGWETYLDCLLTFPQLHIAGLQLLSQTITLP